MQTRKIFRVGRGSYVVTLPPDWVEKLSEPEVIMVYNGVLLVVPKDKEGLIDLIMDQAIKLTLSKEVKQHG
jgi:phosphate uptake regulator